MNNRPTCSRCGTPIDYRTVSGLCKEHFEGSGGRSLPIPEGFAAFAEHKGWREICPVYGISRATLTIWRRETAIAQGARFAWSNDDDGYLRANYRALPVGDIAAKLNRTIASVKTRAKKLGLQGRSKPAFQPQYGFMRDRKPNVSGRVQSSADMAAAFIRAHDRTAIYRTNQDGAPNPKGDHWKYGYGSLVLTEGELLAKAERKGWQPDEWKKLAA